MIRKAAVIIAGLLVVGCNTTPVEITRDEVTARKLRSIPEARLLRDQTTFVRTYTGTEKKRTEVSGARCTLKTADVTAQVTTPAKVRLPVYVQGKRFENRGRPSDMTITCRADGQTTTVTVAPEPIGTSTYSSSNTAYYNDGSSSITTVVTHASRLSSSYPWGYGPSIGVMLK